MGREFKALVLSGGRGTRLRPLTHTMAKQLVPVANKPILGYVFDHLREAGIGQVGVIVAPETRSEIEKYLGGGGKWGLSVQYIQQHEPLGLAHAVKVARAFLADSPFVMYLGDNLLRAGIQEALRQFQSENPDALIFLKEVPNPQAFGIAVLNGDGHIEKLIEKPPDPPTNLALVGVYLFSPRIHEAVERIRPSRRGELEITDAIQELIKQDAKVVGNILEGWWLDTGKKDDFLAANTVVLDSYMERDIQGDVDGESRIDGRVKIDRGASVVKSAVRGPVIIGAGAEIRESFIGPFTSIGDESRIIRSGIEHSVILEGAAVEGVERLEDSIVGREARIVRRGKRTNTLCLMVGDHALVEI